LATTSNRAAGAVRERAARSPRDYLLPYVHGARHDLLASLYHAASTTSAFDAMVPAYGM